MKYRKKPIVISAVQLTPKRALDCLRGQVPIIGDLYVQGSWNSLQEKLYDAHVLIKTLEGTMRADLNDWIIKGVNGEFYPCKPDIFEKTYDLAD